MQFGLIERAACLVCHAPAHPVREACVFCRSPLKGSGDPLELLPYLARRLPGARVGRGWLRDGPIQDVSWTIGPDEYRIRRRRSQLVLSPALSPVEWIRELIGAWSNAARDDLELRTALSRTGWSWR
jgi:hypothetical protein